MHRTTAGDARCEHPVTKTARGSLHDLITGRTASSSLYHERKNPSVVPDCLGNAICVTNHVFIIIILTDRSIALFSCSLPGLMISRPLLPTAAAESCAGGEHGVEAASQSPIQGLRV